MPISPRWSFKQRLAIAFLLFATSAGCLALFLWWTKPADPKVQERHYSAWLQRLTPSGASSFVAASNVVRTVGRNGFPLLRSYLKSRESRIREVLVLRGISPPEILVASQRQVSACNAVAVLGNDAAELMPLVTPLLTNEVDGVRLAALRAVAANKVDVPEQYLLEAVANERILVSRVHAARALLRRGMPAQNVLHLLSSTMAGRLISEKGMRQFLWALEQLNLPDEDITALYAEWATSPDHFTRRLAAHLLLYSERTSTLDAAILEGLANDTNIYVWKPARAALEKRKADAK